MSEPKFTKGPWHIVFGRNKRTETNYPHQVSSDSGKGIITWGSISRKATLEGQSNAKLIASAPDAYDLAVEIVNHLYTKQDISRVRSMAKEFIEKVVK